jgi:Tol biopolymer transport system component
MRRTKVIAFLLTGFPLVAAAPGSVAASPAKSPWRIALTSDREGDSEIYSMNADGRSVRRLTRSPKFDAPGPWSPDGRRMLFYSQRSPKGDVWVMNADGSHQRNLTRNEAHDSGGTWSPDGRKIAFDTNRDGNSEIYVMGADGSGQRILSPRPSSNELAGGWSSDGRTMLFVTDRDGNWEIYAMKADGTNPRNLTQSAGNDGGVGGVARLVWSPDRRRIAFASTRDTRDENNPELYVMNVDGSNLRRLTHTSGTEAPFSWSPDGTRLAFTRDPVKPRWAFFVMRADGSAVRKVTWSVPGSR